MGAHRNHTLEKGIADGLATLDGSVLVPATQMPVLVGDSGAGGTKGAAPAPAAGDAAANKFLHADGTWTIPADMDAKYAVGYGLFSASTSYIEITSASYASVTAFRFRGTSAGANPNMAKAILFASSSTNIGVRFYDVTNGNVIAEQSSLAVTDTAAIYDLGAISNLPSAEAVFEIQLKKVGSGKPRISSFEFFES